MSLDYSRYAMMTMMAVHPSPPGTLTPAAAAAVGAVLELGLELVVEDEPIEPVGLDAGVCTSEMPEELDSITVSEVDLVSGIVTEMMLGDDVCTGVTSDVESRDAIVVSSEVADPLA
jgi:hypothetical protein